LILSINKIRGMAVTSKFLFCSWFFVLRRVVSGSEVWKWNLQNEIFGYFEWCQSVCSELIFLDKWSYDRTFQPILKNNLVQTCAGHAICPSWAQYIVVLIPASTFMNDVLKNILKKNKFLYYYFLDYFYFFIRSFGKTYFFLEKLPR
jgi:hypothetical protein